MVRVAKGISLVWYAGNDLTVLQASTLRTAETGNRCDRIDWETEWCGSLHDQRGIQRMHFRGMYKINFYTRVIMPNSTFRSSSGSPF